MQPGFQDAAASQGSTARLGRDWGATTRPQPWRIEGGAASANTTLQVCYMACNGMQSQLLLVLSLLSPAISACHATLPLASSPSGASLKPLEPLNLWNLPLTGTFGDYWHFGPCPSPANRPPERPPRLPALRHDILPLSSRPGIHRPPTGPAGLAAPIHSHLPVYHAFFCPSRPLYQSFTLRHSLGCCSPRHLWLLPPTQLATARHHPSPLPN
jgi:hypothetical protein